MGINRHCNPCFFSHHNGMSLSSFSSLCLAKWTISLIVNGRASPCDGSHERTLGFAPYRSSSLLLGFLKDLEADFSHVLHPNIVEIAVRRENRTPPRTWGSLHRERPHRSSRLRSCIYCIGISRLLTRRVVSKTSCLLSSGCKDQLSKLIPGSGVEVPSSEVQEYQVSIPGSGVVK